MPDTPMSVLLVEDDVHTCNVVDLVMKHHHCALTVANDAESAMGYLNDHQPDVILMDIFLPGMDGYQALARIRQESAADDSAVVAITAYYTADTQQDVMQWGFNGFLPKPLNPSTLVTYLQQVVSAHR